MSSERPEPRPDVPPDPRLDLHTITAAPSPRSAEQAARVQRYLISMLIRTVCVVCAVLVGGPLRWVLIVGAVVLPYVAVVMANAVGSGTRRAPGPAPVQLIALPRDPETAGSDTKPDRRSAEWSNYGSGEQSP